MGEKKLFPANGADSWIANRERKKAEEFINKYSAQLSREKLPELSGIFEEYLEASGYITPDIFSEK